jgi:hypothetical protein
MIERERKGERAWKYAHNQESIDSAREDCSHGRAWTLYSSIFLYVKVQKYNASSDAGLAVSAVLPQTIQ